MNTAAIAEFIDLTSRKRSLSAQLKGIQEQLDMLEPGIIEAMQADGVQSVKVDGMLAYLSTRTWAKVEFPNLPFLSEAGYGQLLTVNYAKAGSLLSELQASSMEGELHTLAQAGITPNEVTKLNIKKG